MRLQNIYDSIPDAIDRVVEEVVAKYEWVDVQNPYRSFLPWSDGVYRFKIKENDMMKPFGIIRFREIDKPGGLS